MPETQGERGEWSGEYDENSPSDGVVKAPYGHSPVCK